MKPAHQIKTSLQEASAPDSVELVIGRGGQKTLKVNGIFLHSRYNPEQEAKRLIDSASLDPKRPVLVVGLGLGYHVKELLHQDYEVAVVEPEPYVARLALEGPLASEEFDFLLDVGDIDTITATDSFQSLAARLPQVLVHPATARAHQQFAEELPRRLSTASLGKQHLSIAIVGPMYGGSLPIAQYLTDAFTQLGHRAKLIDNSVGWEFYETVRATVENEKPQAQLTQMLTHFLSEWTYVRVREFNPEICIVIAQAPVSQNFPARLAKQGIVSAFWYVENWRHLPYWKDIAPYYDYFFHIQPGDFEEQLEAAGCHNHAFVQTACAPEVHKPVALSEKEHQCYDCDISFAGAGYYNRLQMFSGLTDYDFKIWGVDWYKRELAPLVVDGGRRFSSEEFMKIVAASKINLNLHSSTTNEAIDTKCDAINPRVFEIAAAGGFQLCDPAVGLDQFFDFETELPVYHDLAELREKIDYFLAHPEERAAFAKRAQEHILAEHTYTKRAQQMLDLILERYGTRILKHGVRVQHTVHETAEKLPAESELRQWLQTLPPDVLFTQDGIAPHIRAGHENPSYPEKIFSYLTEMRMHAETLLKMKR